MSHREVPLQNEDILLSTTDTRSHITYANRTFCEIAGYSIEEMTNRPHNMVRHPDMPATAFENLWSHLKKGQSWMGLVKNRCKNGDFYWVNAFVTPITDSQGNVREYQSVRTKPDAGVLDRAKKLYPKLNGKAGQTFLKRITRQFDMSWFILAILYCTTFVSTCLFLLSEHYWLSGLLLLLLSIGSWVYTRWFKKYQQLLGTAQSVFSNPFMSYLYSGHRDKISDINLALQMRRAELRAIIGRVLDVATDIHDSADSTEATASEVSHNLQRQKAETLNIATAMEQMETTIGELANLIHQASQFAQQSTQLTTKGQQNVAHTQKQIATLATQLTQASEQVSGLINGINRIEDMSNEISEIADQTNLLALNAAIEAARAGEQGRGFSVVADEVRNLAVRTQQSTQQINHLLHDLLSNSGQVSTYMQQSLALSQHSVESANQAHCALQDIRTQVEKLASLNEQTAAAVEEQSAVTAEVSRNTASISELAKQSEASSLIVTKSVDTLRHKLEDQNSLLRQFIQRH